MKFIKKSFLSVTVLMLSLPIVPMVIARDFQDSPQPPADNTKTNQRDRDRSAPTADQQKVNPSDREITRKATLWAKHFSFSVGEIKYIAKTSALPIDS